MVLWIIYVFFCSLNGVIENDIHASIVSKRSSEVNVYNNVINI